MKKLLLIALSTAALGAQAADTKYYAGANIGFWDMSTTSGITANTNFDSTTLEGYGGYQFYEKNTIDLSVEGRFGLGIEADTETVYDAYGQEGTNANFNQLLNYYASLYLKSAITNRTGSFYALFGGSAINMTTKAPLIDGSGTIQEIEGDTESGLSYGLGMGFFLSENAILNIEWKRLFKKDSAIIQGATVGFDMKF